MAMTRPWKSATQALVLLSIGLACQLAAAQSSVIKTIDGRVNREGKETYKFAFNVSGKVTVELSGFPEDCTFQVGSTGFQESDSSPVDWTDGQAGKPVKHSFSVQAGRPGEVWVDLKRFGSVSTGNWMGVQGSKDGPYYSLPERDKPVEPAPASFEGKPVRPPITFRLTFTAGAGGTAQPPSLKAGAGAGQEAQRCQKLASALIEYHQKDCETRRAKWPGYDYQIEYVVRPNCMQKNGQWFVVAAWKLLEKAPGKDFYPVFESGDATNPQWLNVGTVEALVKQAGITIK